MRTIKLRHYSWIVILASSLVSLPGWAEETLSSDAADAPELGETETVISPPQKSQEIYLADLKQEHSPATTVQEWIAQIEAAIAPITAINLNRMDTGVEIVLQTAEGRPLAVDSNQFRTEGNALVADIPNARLALPNAQEFSVDNPTDDITSVRVTQLDSSNIRIRVTGNNTLPRSAVILRTGGLTYSLNPQADRPDIEILVTGDREDGYNPFSASTATGTNTPLRDVPLSIQVVPQQVLEDRQVRELETALETVGGVSPAGGRGTSVAGPGILIRGFLTPNSILRGGINITSLSPLSTTDIERVEVLKGPASVLFGQGEPGGVINLVPKRPLRDPLYSFSATAGNFNTYQGAIDFSGPLNADRSLRYRLNVSYDNYGSFRNFVNGERLLVSPILTWDITPNTSIDFYGQYTRDRETIDEGIVAIGRRPANVPRDRFLGEPFAEFEQDQFNLGYRLNHRINANVSLRHALQYTQYTPKRYGPLFDSIDEETGELARYEYYAGGTYRRFFTNAEVVGEFNTGYVRHQILFGTEYRRDSENPLFQFSNEYPSIDIFNPVYTRRRFPIEPEFFRDDRINTIGVYLQDQMEIFPNFKVLAGIRYDHIHQFRTTRDVGEPRNEFVLRNDRFTPRLGAVYQPIPPVSLYASYSTSFRPAFGATRNRDGSTFEPETGRQLEVGVKADLLERLSLTLAAFDIRKQNVRTPDPNNPGFSLQTGEVASRGIELSLGGQILPGWNITAAYTYLDAFVSQDNRPIVGNRLTSVPENQFSLWTTYEVQQGNLQGLGFGLGTFFVGDRQGDLENTFILPSYFRTDAALFYRRNNWRAQLNFQNLFNTEYFTSASYRLNVTPGAPFTVLGTVSVDF
ncbi:TonB-dependent siderophore receptor [Desertifilum sp. FACHB-1129]|uniref:Ligand-gated channel n=1 Tax=Desertifilum tharense IPPAS B-1220 TaxID=1781255 RepID=A0A1E5QK83_9CYAN|nr:MULTISPECIES: TonB-dependent siderophore receptor [Desertifilum]MDA0211095.1 TonB-dependent siderophore receptor [Cyanobacteria bacterium FC1]MBD2314169.1 TonB-dependent siderophore receptor [Desertifilum sp. FACHB-1129]MBD2320134.1 TonB-dependent siderophore receptor [Desertifilum sp. FACHB-866]MBD2330262.1 TonB-dependent siderophore receptor [Desertifilum sp. FACHB-868]OEJ75106.1 ligand-gated channel [Desertifilum tharense IPPAS B-1220]